MNTPWRLYGWIAVTVLAAAVVLGLTACQLRLHRPCTDHGGVRWTNGKVYECNDGTWQ